MVHVDLLLHRVRDSLCRAVKGKKVRTLDAASETSPGAMSDSIPEAIPKGIANRLIAGALASIPDSVLDNIFEMDLSKNGKQRPK